MKQILSVTVVIASLYVAIALFAMFMLGGCGRPDPHWCECTATCGDGAQFSVDSVFWVDSASVALRRGELQCTALPPCIVAECSCVCERCVDGAC